MHHLQSGAALTIATHRREVKIDFGVLHLDQSGIIHDFSEKPTFPYDVSMGVYILNRHCLEFVPKGRPFGFDELVMALLEANEKVVAFPHQGNWLDLGRIEDYEQANRATDDSGDR